MTHHQGFSELPNGSPELNSFANSTSIVDLTDPTTMAQLSDLRSRETNTSEPYLPMVALFEGDAPTADQATALTVDDPMPSRPRNALAPGEQQQQPGQLASTYQVETTTGTDGTTEVTTRDAQGRIATRTRTNRDGELLESETNNPDGSSETFTRLNDGSTRVRRVNGDNIHVTTTEPGGATEVSIYAQGVLQSRTRQNTDGSTLTEGRDPDGSRRATRRGADGSLIEDRVTTTDAQGLRTTMIVCGNGLRRRETELPGNTSELPEALHTSGLGAQHLRVDYFDPGDPTGRRVSRSSIYYTGNGIGPEGPTILRAERSFDGNGRVLQSIDYIPITGYRVNGYDSNGNQISTRLNPLYVHDGYARRRG